MAVHEDEELRRILNMMSFCSLLDSMDIGNNDIQIILDLVE